MEENNTHPEETGLADELNAVIQHEHATQGQRFLNWLIDVLFMRFILSQATGYVLGYILALVAPEFVLQLAYEIDGEKTWRFWLAAILLSYLNFFIYYTICERAFKGYTLGKAITGTRAIRDDGQDLTFKDAILRTLARMIPFEVLSGFGARPWHDSLTKTSVVKTR